MRRPKKTWRSTFKEDLEDMGVSWHGDYRNASDRESTNGGVSSTDVPRGTGRPKSLKLLLSFFNKVEMDVFQRI